MDLLLLNYSLAQRHTTKSVIIMSLNLLKVTAGQRNLGAGKRIIKGFPQDTASYKMENLNLEEIIISIQYEIPFRSERDQFV